MSNRVDKQSLSILIHLHLVSHQMLTTTFTFTEKNSNSAIVLKTFFKDGYDGSGIFLRLLKG